MKLTHSFYKSLFILFSFVGFVIILSILAALGIFFAVCLAEKLGLSKEFGLIIGLPLVFMLYYFLARVLKHN